MNIVAVAAAKVREKFADMVLRVFMGQIVVVTHHGKAYAALIPIVLLQRLFPTTNFHGWFDKSKLNILYNTDE